MTGGINETVPKVLKALWDLENELRGAARNGVILQGEEARSHLHPARHHLDELLKIVSPSDSARAEEPSSTSTSTASPPTATNRL
jgi:hypothetical protein